MVRLAGLFEIPPMPEIYEQDTKIQSIGSHVPLPQFFASAHVLVFEGAT